MGSISPVRGAEILMDGFIQKDGKVSEKEVNNLSQKLNDVLKSNAMVSNGIREKLIITQNMMAQMARGNIHQAATLQAAVKVCEDILKNTKKEEEKSVKKKVDRKSDTPETGSGKQGG